MQRGGLNGRSSSASGQTRNWKSFRVTSALLLEADLSLCPSNVGFGLTAAVSNRSKRPRLVGGREAAADQDRPVRIRGSGKILERWASLGFDVRCPDHLGPLFGFVGDELAEVAGRS